MPIRKGFCLFLADVICVFVKSDKPVVMNRCFKCKYYFRFNREMEQEEEEFFEECERIWKYGYPKKFDVPKE